VADAAITSFESMAKYADAPRFLYRQMFRSGTAVLLPIHMRQSLPIRMNDAPVTSSADDCPVQPSGAADSW